MTMKTKTGVRQTFGAYSLSSEYNKAVKKFHVLCTELLIELIGARVFSIGGRYYAFDAEREDIQQKMFDVWKARGDLYDAANSSCIDREVDEEAIEEWSNCYGAISASEDYRLDAEIGGRLVNILPRYEREILRKYTYVHPDESRLKLLRFEKLDKRKRK